MINIKNNIKKKMKSSINSFKNDLLKIQTGRINISLFDNIYILYYNSSIPISQISKITLKNNNLINIKPWEKKFLKNIEKVIHKSNLGLYPIIDGDIISITIPPLSKERRYELIKIIKKIKEKYKTSIRNLRRNANEQLKNLQKFKNISKDEKYKFNEQIQELTNKYISIIEKLIINKEKELITI